VADEALEFQQRLIDVPHLQNPDRVASATIAIEELQMQVLVLDDAFQHRKIARDLDVVLIDCTQPFGFGCLLPRGLLREPMTSLSRAGLVVLTRCDRVSDKELIDIEDQIRNFTSAPIVKTQTNASHLLQADGQTKTIEDLIGKKVFAFAGIGNPANFWETLESLGMLVQGKMPFPDHHDFDREDINRIGTHAGRAGVEAIVCTHKDLVKVTANQLNEIPVFALVVDVEIIDGEQAFKTAIKKVIGKIAPEPV